MEPSKILNVTICFNKNMDKKIKLDRGSIRSSPKYDIGPNSKKIQENERFGKHLKQDIQMVVCDWGQFWGVLVGLDNEKYKLLMKISSLSYSYRLCGE